MPGFHSCPPEFVGVGSQRSGTSWWFSLLLEHPDIEGGVDRRKELHYFDRYCDEAFGVAEIARYHASFPHARGALRGEWTPRYMFDFWTPRLLARAAPEARLLVMLRDPIARFRSGVAHERGLRGHQPWKRKLFAGAALARSRYHAQLSRLCDYFPESQILVLQYEQCVAQPLALYGRTLSFLGAAAFEPGAERIRRTVGTVAEPPPLPPQVHTALVEELSDDVRRLCDRFSEIDVDLWPSFAPETVAGLPRGWEHE